MRKHKSLLILALCGGTALLALVVLSTLTDARPGGHSMTRREMVIELFNEKKLRMYAEVHGSQALVEYALKAGVQYSIANQHQIGHALGEVLYEREGLSALGLCGDLFTYGCLHQIIGKAYEEQGPQSLEKLDEICRTQAFVKYGKCLHALGHGLVYANGYDLASLEKSLATCDGIQEGIPFDYEDSCYGGAFMEYNMHFMDDNEGAFGLGRTYDVQAPLAPCTSLSDPAHQETCSFWLVPWVHGQLSEWKFTPSAFEQLGSFCHSIESERLRVPCEYAVGRDLAMPGNLSFSSMASLCKSAFQDDLEYERCIFGAVRLLKKYQSEAIIPLCARINENKIDSCISFSRAPETKWSAAE